MTLNQLTYFRKIARLEHFSRAAEELNISQPSLSRSMDTLERELGLPLFEKQGRNVVLTKYGRIFLTHAERILEEVAAAERKMQYLTKGGGHVDIAYVSPLANYYIPHTVRSFLNLEENKNVTFSFSQARTSDLIAGLKNETYDIVFRSLCGGSAFHPFHSHFKAGNDYHYLPGPSPGQREACVIRGPRTISAHRV